MIIEMLKIQNKETECPICSKKTCILPLRKIKGSRTGKKNIIYYCFECDFIYLRPEYCESDVDLRNDLQWHIKNIESTIMHSDEIIKMMLKMNPNASTMLDIGCGIGASIIAAKKYDIDACGVEINTYAVDYAKNKYEINIKKEYFNSDTYNKIFDIIIVDNVLEHVLDPKSFIQHVSTSLNSHGLLYMAIPGRWGGWLRIIYSLMYPLRKYSIFVDNDVHINIFSKKSIERLIGLFGMNIITKVSSGSYYIKKNADQ